MDVVFVSGKSGSGKSTFSRLLAERLNVKYVCVDDIAHSIYNESEVIKKVKELYGEEVFENNKVNTKKLGKIYFNERESERTKQFYAFTYEVMSKLIKKSMEGGAVIDWVLFPETELFKENAVKVLVSAVNDEVRFKKIMERDNISYEYMLSREKSCPKMVEEEFDYVVYNDYNGSLNEEVEKIAKLIKEK